MRITCTIREKNARRPPTLSTTKGGEGAHSLIRGGNPRAHKKRQAFHYRKYALERHPCNAQQLKWTEARPLTARFLLLLLVRYLSMRITCTIQEKNCAPPTLSTTKGAEGAHSLIRGGNPRAQNKKANLQLWEICARAASLQCTRIKMDRGTASYGTVPAITASTIPIHDNYMHY